MASADLRVVIEPTTSWPEVTAVLAEAQQRMSLAGGNELAGYLAVVDVQGPDRVEGSITGEAPAPAAAEAGPVEVTVVLADGETAVAAFDPEGGYHMLVLGPVPADIVTAALENPAGRLARVGVRCGPHTVRPAVGVGLVALKGCPDDTSTSPRCCSGSCSVPWW